MNDYDLTVITGLEAFAIRECKKKLNVSDVDHRDGHIYLKTDDDFQKLAKLKSVDNIHAVIYDRELPELSTIESDDLIELFKKIIPECHWKKGIRIWSDAFQYYDNPAQPLTQAQWNEILDTDFRNVDHFFKPTFRVSCNRNGKHKIQSPRVASDFGCVLNDTFFWKVDLCHYQLKVQLTVNNNRFLVAIQLTREALFKRFIVDFGRTTLRGTIAYALLQIADPKPGEIVYDSMCGSGVIPIEAAHDWPDIFSLGSDHHPKAIEKTIANIRANPLPNLNILQMDTTRLAFRDNTVDCFVTDLPFGRRMGSKTINATLYPALLAEMLRVCRLGTGRIVWLTADRRNANLCFNKDSPLKQYFMVVKCHFVKVGGLDSSIYHLQRNNKEYQSIQPVTN